MIDLGQHAQFITAAYAGVVLGLFALIAWIIVDARRVKARLAELGDTRG